MKSYLSIVFCLSLFATTFAQNREMSKDTVNGVTYFKNDKFHNAVIINPADLEKTSKPKNVILFIGDGMGLAHIFGALTANRGELNINHFKKIGFSKTSSASDFVTDSGAGGTAISTGKKTYNEAIAVDSDSLQIYTILEIFEHNGFSTGVVATSCITHATPASFIAHNKNRFNYEEIALSILKNDPEVLIGGGLHHFTKRKDGRNLIDDFTKKNYQVCYYLDEKIIAKKFICLTDTIHPPVAKIRGEYLSIATKKALDLLSINNKGFFLMVEGSQIDWGGHYKNLPYIIEETLDMDKAIGVALEFAAKNGETLIIVTADHETGGLAILGGNKEKGEVNGAFTTDDHSGLMVPVFAIGPGSDNFMGIYENTQIFYSILDALEIKIPKTK